MVALYRIKIDLNREYKSILTLLDEACIMSLISISTYGLTSGYRPVASFDSGEVTKFDKSGRCWCDAGKKYEFCKIFGA